MANRHKAGDFNSAALKLLTEKSAQINIGFKMKNNNHIYTNDELSFLWFIKLLVFNWRKFALICAQLLFLGLCPS